jgi:tetratricopeptide (TPR) repeat protein
MRALRSAAILVALHAAAPLARAAEPDAAPAQSGNDEREARRLFQKAELSFNLGKFEEALADYQAAYQAKPLNGFLFNIAQCYRNLGNWERARFFYRRYLTLEPRSPNRHRVEDLVAEMSDKIEKQQAQAAPAPTPPPPTPAPAPATTEPPAAPVAPAPVEPVAGPGAAAPEPKLDAPAPASSDATTLVSTPAEPEATPVYKRWWFWGGVGAVVVGGAVAAILLTRPETKTPGTLDPIDARP